MTHQPGVYMYVPLRALFLVFSVVLKVYALQYFISICVYLFQEDQRPKNEKAGIHRGG